VDAPRPPRFQRLSRRQLAGFDLLLAALVGQILLNEVLRRPHLALATPITVVVVLSATVALRRWRPWWALGFSLAASLFGMIAGFLTDPMVALALVLYVVVVTQPTRPGLLALLAIEASITGAVFASALAWRPLPLTVLPGTGIVQAVTWVAATAVRRQRQYRSALHRYELDRVRADHALAAAQAGQAVAEERLRIAQELHDVLAHSVSVIAVQAGMGHLVIDDQPGKARQALAAIEVTSRTALDEVRHLLTALRRPDPATVSAEASARPGEPGQGVAPVHTLADLPELIRQLGQTGLQVDLRIAGEPRQLPATMELTIYRIIQEALTNVIKHASTDRGRVLLEYSHSMLVIEITDNGPADARSRPVPSDVPPGGHGLIGMRERVAVYGGSLVAGPLPHRGFRVLARLPFPAA
jgi:signal transduction histidine kinase